MRDPSFITLQSPAVRLFTADIGKLSREKHTIRALVEVDLTDSLEKIRQLRKSGEKVSFLAWFIKVLADTVTDHPPVNGIQKGRRSLHVFKNIHVSTVVEKTVNGEAVPLPMVVREANHKTPIQISAELQKAVDQSVEGQGSPTLDNGANDILTRLGLIMPQWLRVFVLRTFILANPQRMQAIMGTVMVTSLGTLGRQSAWILPTSIHPLSVGIGTLTKKPTLVQGQIIPRQILHLTITLDHDVIDGMPARRFVDDLVTRLTRGDLLVSKTKFS